jgi:aminoglycoside phosphotransferase (APT) family kinase protein
VSVRELTGGLFAAVQQVELSDGRTVVTKTGVSPAIPRPPLLTYERDLLRAEIALLRAAAPAPVPTPAVLHADLTRCLVDVDVLVMEHVPGTSWQEVRTALPDDVNRRTEHEWGGVLAGFHTQTGRLFGYPSSPGLQGQHWPEVFSAMVDALLTDAVTWGVDVEAGRVRAALADATGALAPVTEPVLVHMDLWPGNVLIDTSTGRITGVVDLERGIFGDPLMDLVGAEAMSVVAPSAGLLEGYRSAGGHLPDEPTSGTLSGFDAAADRRLALYRLYLTLLMTIEIVPRAYAGDWLGEYRQTLLANRADLFDQLGV